MRLTTSKGREFAFKTQKKRNKRRGKHEWYVGISFKNHLAIDLDDAPLKSVIRIGKELQSIYYFLYKVTKIVDIHKTNRGYWLIMRYVPNKFCRKMWAIILNNSFYIYDKYESEYICKDFLKISLKYNKSTLRVSKKGDNIPKKIGLINLYGNFKFLGVEGIAETTIPHTAVLPKDAVEPIRGNQG